MRNKLKFFEMSDEKIGRYMVITTCILCTIILSLLVGFTIGYNLSRNTEKRSEKEVMNILEVIEKDDIDIENISIDIIDNTKFLNNVGIKVLKYQIIVKDKKDNKYVYYTDSEFRDTNNNRYNYKKIHTKDEIEEANWLLDINNKYLQEILK